MRVKKTAYVGMLSALSIVISAFESFFPLMLPGLKLGLANIVTVFALYYVGTKEAYFVLGVRCLVSSILFGGVTTLAFSLCGGLLSLTSSLVIKKFFADCFSFIGVCVIGAALFNVGQIGVCAVIFRSTAVLGYLPLLLLGSVVCGGVTGIILNKIPQRLCRYGKNAAKKEEL